MIWPNNVPTHIVTMMIFQMSPSSPLMMLKRPVLTLVSKMEQVPLTSGNAAGVGDGADTGVSTGLGAGVGGGACVGTGFGAGVSTGSGAFVGGAAGSGVGGATGAIEGVAVSLIPVGYAVVGVFVVAHVGLPVGLFVWLFVA